MPARSTVHECAVPSCPYPGRNQVGIRDRVAHSGASPFPNKRRTDALWSVESSIFLCDHHALQGGVIRLTFEPNASQEIIVESECGGVELEARSKQIRQPLEEAA
jgi:hypothetical protein